jgi:hypothetical protein
VKPKKNAFTWNAGGLNLEEMVFLAGNWHILKCLSPTNGDGHIYANRRNTNTDPNNHTDPKGNDHLTGDPAVSNPNKH